MKHSSTLLTMLVAAAVLGPIAQGAALQRPSPDVAGGDVIDAIWTSDMSNVTHDILNQSPIKFWTNMNDGAGSGLDADLLGSFNSSFYLGLIANEAEERLIGITNTTQHLETLVTSTFDGVLGEIDGVNTRLMANLTNVKVALEAQIGQQDVDIAAITALSGSLLENLTAAQDLLDTVVIQTNLLGTDVADLDLAVDIVALSTAQTNATAQRLDGLTHDLELNVGSLLNDISGIQDDVGNIGFDVQTLNAKAEVVDSLVADAYTRIELARGEVTALGVDVDTIAQGLDALQGVETTANSAKTAVDSLTAEYNQNVPQLLDRFEQIAPILAAIEGDMGDVFVAVALMQDFAHQIETSVNYMNATIDGMRTNGAVFGRVTLADNTAYMAYLNTNESNVRDVSNVGPLTRITSGRVDLGPTTHLDTSTLALGNSHLTDGTLDLNGASLTSSTLNVAGSTLTGTTLNVDGSTLTGSDLTIGSSNLASGLLNVAGSTLSGTTLDVSGSTLTGSALNIGSTSLTGSALSLAGNTLGSGGLSLPTGALVALGSSTLSGTQLNVAGTTLDANGLVAGAAALDANGILSLGASTLLDATKLQIGTSILDDALSLGTNLLGTDLLAGALRLGDLTGTMNAIRLGDLSALGAGTGVGVLVGSATSITDGEIGLGTGTTLTDGLVASTNVKVKSLLGCSIVSTSATGLLDCSGINPTTLVRTDLSIGTSGGLQGGGALAGNLALSLADAGVTTSKLADAGVTTSKLADAAISTAKIANNAVTDGKIASLGWSKLSGFPSACASGQAISALTASGATCVSASASLNTLAENGVLRFHAAGNQETPSYIQSPWDLYVSGDVDGDDAGLGQVGGAWFRVWTAGQTHEQMRIMWGDEAPALFDGAVTANGLDLAEAYINGDALMPGELVRIDPLNPQRVLRTTGVHDAGVLGVVSTAPGMVLSDGIPSEEDLAQIWGADVLSLWKLREPILKAAIRAADTQGMLDDVRVNDAALMQFAEEALAKIALAGRVPVKVDASYGAIETGDLLAASPIPGVAMKAQGAGTTIGVALQALPVGQAAISMFVQRGHLAASPSAPTIPLGLSEGDVVVMDGFTADGKLKVRPATSARDPGVVGVVSTKATQTLSGVDRDAPIASTGIVTVKVVGPIAKGALLTSSATPGRAAACAADCDGAIIGKALEAWSGMGAGSIRVLVSIA